MKYQKLFSISLFLTLVILFTGCSVTGGKCTYNDMSSYAVVKGIALNKYAKKDFNQATVTLDIDTWMLMDKQKTQTIQKKGLTYVQFGEVLPAKVSTITKGSCVPQGVSLDALEYFAIKNTVIHFITKREIEKNADKKIKNVAKHFLALQKKYPDAILRLHGYAYGSGSDSRRVGRMVLYYNTVYKSLQKEGIDTKFLKRYPSSPNRHRGRKRNAPKEGVAFEIKFKSKEIINIKIV